MGNYFTVFAQVDVIVGIYLSNKRIHETKIEHCDVNLILKK